MKVATGISVGSEVSAHLVTDAVTKAMRAADISVASSVLLFLTSDFARDPAPALRAAAKAASCTQVMGCSAPGIFTEEDWVLDAPAAAALVLSDDVCFMPPSLHDAQQLLLTIAAPNAINVSWMSAPGVRFGGVSGDAIGQGPFSVWKNGKGAVEGYFEAALHGVRGVIAASHGLHILGAPQRITKVTGHDLEGLADMPSLKSLQQACGLTEALPLHKLMAIYADSVEAMMDGDYQLAALVSGNDEANSVTLSKRVQTRQYLCWALREADAALADLKKTAINLQTELATKPDFALLFSCLGRGPYFYGGIDRDLELLKKVFPQMPLIGFYGNGEIAPSNIKQNGVSDILQYSAVLSLFSQAGA